MRFSLTTAAFAFLVLATSSTVSARTRAGQLCGTNQPVNRTLEAQLAPIIASEKSKEASQRATPRKIKVYAHVISNGTRGKIPLSRVKKQISVLNKDYYSANYHFSLVSTSYTSKPAWYGVIDGDTNKIGLQMRKALYKGGKDTLNIYITNLGRGLLGFAAFPWLYNTTGSPAWADGVVLHTQTLPSSNSTSFAPYNLGRTATHEVGHWLGLYHPFQGESCDVSNPGDYIADTPLQLDPTFGCPASKNSCPSAGNDVIHNFMDYSDDSCMQSFTRGQKTRMHAISTKFRGL
ncbi:hypothetical protein A4X09_0g602 [Tilletia walkeri]|uniref:Peptidase M43 pregnancy-associated plasma-A domain-containing protein n=1 Tax=Tilletia walkeri TaxID=117179 RepID=A0A8X7T7K7_9BASI|nr:hypothetical protein A4X09_0g602 [Tilletia walkeri]